MLNINMKINMDMLLANKYWNHRNGYIYEEAVVGVNSFHSRLKDYTHTSSERPTKRQKTTK